MNTTRQLEKFNSLISFFNPYINFFYFLILLFKINLLFSFRKILKFYIYNSSIFITFLSSDFFSPTSKKKKKCRFSIDLQQVATITKSLVKTLHARTVHLGSDGKLYVLHHHISF